MAQQTLVPPPTPRVGPNLSDAPEFGDSWSGLIAKLTSMFTELFTAKNVFAKYVTNATSGATTAAAGDLTGAQSVVANYSAVGANNLTTRTAAQMIADANLSVGQSYDLEIMNTSGATMTLVGGTGVTISGVATIATTVARFYVVTVTGAAAITIQSVGSGSTL